jgi:hypothetical protein
MNFKTISYFSSAVVFQERGQSDEPTVRFVLLRYCYQKDEAEEPENLPTK